MFGVREVDLDYEFDAAMYFDFTRPESPAEARQAELWFESAVEYPPSPFVVKLVDTQMGNVNVSPKSKDLEGIMDTDDGASRDFCTLDVNSKECEGIDTSILTKLQSGYLQKILNQPLELTTGMTFSHHTSTDEPKSKAKSAVKAVFPRSSTLLKPTASQLAKQNHPHQVAHSRFKMQVQNFERSLPTSGVESQASKRQKLEGGHLRKVTDTNQQTNLVHKPSKKDETVEKNSVHGRLRLTIPREPELETAQRAQRIRPKNSTELEHVKSTARRFKARPLNRKILEAPSLSLPKKSTPKLPDFQEFHLKTSARAMQHTSTPSSLLNCNDSGKGLDNPGTSLVVGNGNKDYRRPSTMDASKQDGCDAVHNFKALPLNKKIFSSKGDIGVFRNSKRETTVPVEFNFHTEKRIQNNPPTELFSKLSLTSELQPSNGSRFKLPQPFSLPTKGSKENRSNSSQREHETLHPVRGKPPILGGKPVQCGGDECISEVGMQSMRTLGIR